MAMAAMVAAMVAAMAMAAMAAMAMAARAAARAAANARAARAAKARARAWARTEFIAGSLSQSLSCRFLAIHHAREYPSITAIAVITITLPQNTNGGIVAM